MAVKREIIWIGWDRREAAAYAVAKNTCRQHSSRCIPIKGLVLRDLQEAGLYTRPIRMKPTAEKPVMWDVISDAPQSTEHANSRFLVPFLSQSGWAVFTDGDMLFRDNVAHLLETLDPRFALYCVKHNHVPKNDVKMDGQVQTQYSRKNWSSFMVFNVDHPSNAPLRDSTVMANTLPGRDLHRFCWLRDEEIGELDPAWNYLVGYSDKSIVPKCVHFTSGTPDMPGYENSEYADEWRSQLDKWAA